LLDSCHLPDRLPEQLIVLGGGYIGLELAQAMRRFGAQVTVLQRGHHLAADEDPEVSAAVHDLFRDEGITVHLQTRGRRIPPGSAWSWPGCA
jgi:pyruvate/2-oxoglutarate dehydrogenase complex dihydrolipoamide dehydrogenase (E3) component